MTTEISGNQFRRLMETPIADDVVTVVEERAEVFAKITQEMAYVYKAKNHDYGNSFEKVRDKFPTAILIRLNDKLNRLETLMSGEAAQVKDESIDDTLLDLANYAVMELTARRMERVNH